MELRFKKNSLAIIIPMYNEEKIASRCIDEVFKEIKEIKRNVILMVVNDGSTDKTQNILDSKNKIYKEKLFILTNKKNQGYRSFQAHLRTHTAWSRVSSTGKDIIQKFILYVK